MPGTSGLDFASWVVKHYPLTQIIFLTGHAKFDYAYKAIQISAFDYILKPVKHEVLIECVRRAQDFIRTEKAKNSTQNNGQITYTRQEQIYQKKHNYFGEMLLITV
jgi:two-component system response regulator YesN